MKLLKGPVLAGLLLGFVLTAHAPQLPPPDHKQVACMAMAVKHEAGGESLKGQRAVLDVILNRVYKHNLLPCQVITKPKQFSFYRGKIVASKEDLQRFNIVARMRPVLTKATHFHSLAVQPAWAEKFKRLAVIGNHVFYIDKEKKTHDRY